MTTTLGTSAPAATVAGGVPPEEPGLTDEVRHRLQLITVSVALTVLAFVQAPGRIAPDTKLDLSVDPLGFLMRAFSLWEPNGASGQLQNQAYGYFLPMGPFYLVGNLLGFPAWVVQRLWWALVLLVAFHGMYRLLGRLGIGTHVTMVIASLAYALAPRMITEVGPVSIEAWPIALAPFVLLPLVRVTPGNEVTAAARSGLAIALCGGVNAVAVGAVLPLPFWWLMTRTPSVVRRKLVRWWAVAVLCGTLWWVGPLLLLGRYSPPFLDWVESAAVSTSKATLPGSFRGTTQWVAWFQLPEPIWLAGWSVLSSPAGILLGWLLICLGLLGLLRRDTPHRAFLVGGAIGGLFLLTLGHVGSLTPPWAPAVQNFLDGAGAPLRNTHKFDVVLRIPLIIGLAHALSTLKVPRIPGVKYSSQRILQFTAACAVLGSAAPALVGQLPSRGAFDDVPDYWRQAAAYLEQHDDGARTLIVPGSTFATSVWGDPHDEPFQPLARTKWAVRDGVPLSSAGNIRMLTAIEAQLATGRGTPGLAEFMARAGISRVLVRSDLVRSFQPGSAPLPVTVRSALEQSPGFTPVAKFGPTLQGRRNDALRQVADDGLDIPSPALELWEVDRPTWLAEVYKAQNTLRVAGGTEGLLSLADAGLLGGRATVLDGDPEAAAFAGAPLVTTDTPQRREANVAQVRDLYSLVMTPDQPWQNDRKVHDWDIYPGQPLVTARNEGFKAVTSNTQAAPSVGPWFAFDGDPTTAWVSQQFAIGQWIAISFPEAVELPSTLELTPSPGGARLAAVDVTTDAGVARSEISLDSNLQALPQTIKVPQGPTRSLRITVAKTWQGTDLNAVAISEIRIPERELSRPLVVPAATGDQPPVAISLHSTRDGADSCATVNDRAWCAPRLARQSEDRDIDRIVDVTEPGTYRAVGTALVRAGEDAYPLLDPDGDFVHVAATSTRTADIAQRPQAAMDRSTATGWLASVTDDAPTLKLRWKGDRTVNRLRWQMDEDLLASAPDKLIVKGETGRPQVVTPDEDGWITFRAIRGEALDITVDGVKPLSSLDRVSGFPTALPVGVSEIAVPALDDLRRGMQDWRPVTLPCGAGPPLTVGQTTVRTRVTGTAGQVLRRQPLRVEPCGTVPALRAGEQRIHLADTAIFTPESLTLTLARKATAADRLPATTAPDRIQEVDAEHRRITVAPATADQILVVHENANPGWKATLDGERLATVRVDGWQQGYVVPAGRGGEVDLIFTPGLPYRLILVLGLLLVVALAVFCIPRRRRSTGSRRAARVVEPVLLTENTSRRGFGLAAFAGFLLLGGWWAIGAVVAVLVALRRRVQLRWIVIAAGAVAGVGSMISTNADAKGFWAYASILASLVAIACLVVRLDADGDRVLTRATLAVSRLGGRRSGRPAPREPQEPAGPAAPPGPSTSAP